ncbi:MAG: hypothetical protein IJF03_03015 [Lachnospiraceae bacterium]|nr:hypothetical protein [Lachnospiraceae bacterium]
MEFSSILVQGYCRSLFQERMNPLLFSRESREVKQKKMQEWWQVRQHPFCVDTTFLVTYTLLSKEEFYIWKKCIDYHQKQEWRKTYIQSEYNNRHYESFFGMRASAELDWITGMVLKIRQKSFHEYWELMNGIAMIFPWERQYIQSQGMIWIKDLLQLVSKEDNIILKSGKLLLLLIIAEFYQKQMTRKDAWNKLEEVLFLGMEVYQNYQWSVRLDNLPKISKKIDENFRRHGIHPFRMQQYAPASEEVPEFQEMKEEDWKYMWQMVTAMEKYLEEAEADYKHQRKKEEQEFRMP